MKHIESCIRDANLDPKDLEKVKNIMDTIKNIAATYAILALMDSAVAEEAYAIVDGKNESRNKAKRELG